MRLVCTLAVLPGLDACCASGAAAAAFTTAAVALPRAALTSHLPRPSYPQLLREGKWTFNTFLRNGLLEYLGGLAGHRI